MAPSYDGVNDTNFREPAAAQSMAPRHLSDKDFNAWFDTGMLGATEQGPDSGQQGDTQSTFDHG
jgi:hypothetical protein